MSPKIKFELWRWSYFVVLFLLIGTFGLLLAGPFLVVPFIQWFLHDIPYTLPAWDRMIRLALGVLFLGFFIGTVSWYYEKRSSGR